MAYDENTAERVRRALAGRKNVVERKMMGTLAFVVDDAMCCCVTDDGLMVRVDPEQREELQAAPHVHPVKMRGRVMQSFVRVDASGIGRSASLLRWIERGIAAGARKKPAQRRLSSTKPRRRR